MLHIVQKLLILLFKVFKIELHLLVELHCLQDLGLELVHNDVMHLFDKQMVAFHLNSISVSQTRQLLLLLPFLLLLLL